MRYSWILCLLVLGSAVAQVATAPHSPQQKPAVVDDDDDDDAESAAPAPLSTLAAQTPVITIKGICGRQPAGGASAAKGENVARTLPCETVVTRAQFERLADALQPGMPTSKKQQLGAAYARFIVMAREARRRGLDKEKDFELMLAFARVQILTEELDRSFQNEAAHISDKDVSDYYESNPAAFEQAALQRIFVPRPRQPELVKNAGKLDSRSAETLTRDGMRLEAESIRARAAAGEDFEPLQREAFATAGLKGTSSTDMGTVRRSSLPPSHAGIFELKPGEVSEVISDSTGNYVYRMGGKSKIPFEQVKAEIAETLRAQRLNKLTHSIQGTSTVELNDAYFAPSAGPASVAATAKRGIDTDEPQNATPFPRR